MRENDIEMHIEPHRTDMKNRSIEQEFSIETVICMCATCNNMSLIGPFRCWPRPFLQMFDTLIWPKTERRVSKWFNTMMIICNKYFPILSIWLTCGLPYGSMCLKTRSVAWNSTDHFCFNQIFVWCHLIWCD